MKQIIEIIKKEIENGNNDINKADYTSHTEKGLLKNEWVGELPEIGTTLTNGTQDMKVVKYYVSTDTVGVEFDSGQTVAAAQVIEMIGKKICWIK